VFAVLLSGVLLTGFEFAVVVFAVAAVCRMAMMCM
jgi:hypothetical protein